jgi:S-methylmethionine-dependent homocysteine/selenocysteine methylase
MQQNPHRLKNAIREAANHLLLNNVSTTQMEALLEPIHTILEDEEFWLHPSDGLAVFRSLDKFHTYHLPCPCKEQVVVTNHFYLKPLLPFVTNEMKSREMAAAYYKEYAGTERASSNIRVIIPAAYYGRVESLFVATDGEQWGTFQPTTNTFHIHKEARFNDDDFLDIAATQTLPHDGSVYAVRQADVPGGELVVAVFRY